jgi:hypothetical protein
MVSAGGENENPEVLMFTVVLLQTPPRSNRRQNVTAIFLMIWPF